MLGRLLSVVGAVTTVQAVDFNSVKYDVYFGEVNNDTFDDFYFHGKELNLLLHGDIITPIFIGPQDSYSLQGYLQVIDTGCPPTNCPNPTYEHLFSDTPTPITPSLTEQEIDARGLILLSEGNDYFLADFNNDGITDILLRAEDAEKAYIYAGSAGNAAPSQYQVFTGDLAEQINDRSIGLSLRDANFDGHVDIVFASSDPLLADAAILGGGNYNTIDYVQDNTPAYAATLVGSSGGEFNVSESGSASYSVGIALPQGIAGVTPSVSLSYSSTAGSSLMGHGWAIGAGSAITRCSATEYTDGESKPIQLNSEDKFCLDGQRLVVVDGVYGAANSRYKTEIDNYAFIYAKGGTLGNPSSFDVVSKDGSLKRYGAASNSRLQLAGKTLTWSLADTQDNLGNTISYEYAGGQDDHRLMNIQYADNAARVDFVYDNARPDVQKYFVAGHPMSASKRLKRIEVKDTGQLLRSYHMSYLQATPRNRVSRLSRIQECTAVDSSGAGVNCLPALAFEWQEQKLELDAADAYSFTPANTSTQSLVNYQLADINGDGCQDMIFAWLETDGTDRFETSYTLSTDNCTNYTNVTNAFSHNKLNDQDRYKMQVIDYNADGRQDLAVRYRASDPWVVHLAIPGASGVNWQLSQVPTALPSFIDGDTFMDVDADGLVDHVSGTTTYLLKRASSNPSPTKPFRYESANSVPFGIPNGRQFAEFNGDGAIDSLTYNIVRDTDGFYNGNTWVPGTYDENVRTVSVEVNALSGASTYASFSTTSRVCYSGATNCTPVSEPELKSQMFTADFNGDGYSDLILHRGNNLELRLNTGAGFSGPIALSVTPPTPLPDSDGDGFPDGADRKPLAITDYNRDGMSDLYWHSIEDNRLFVALWNAEAQNFDEAFALEGNLSDDNSYTLLDINGDGGMDLLNVINGYKTGEDKTIVIVQNKDDSLHNVITKIDNNFGNTTTISYDRMNTSEHYARLDVAPFVGAAVDLCEGYNTYEYQSSGAATSNCTSLMLDSTAFYEQMGNPFGLSANDPEYQRPVFDLNTPMPIVTSVASSSPTAANVNAVNKVDYLYTEAKIQAGGRGFLGFKTLTTVDVQTGVHTTTEYHQDFPLTGMPKSTTVTTEEGETLSRAENEYQTTQLGGAVKFYQSHLVKATDTGYATKTNASQGDGLEVLDASPFTETVTLNSYDAHGNLTMSKVNVEGSYVDPHSGGVELLTQEKRTENLYSAAASITLHGKSYTYAELGRLTTATSTGKRNGLIQEPRKVKFEYLANGMLWKEIIEPDSSVLSEKLTTAHTYDAQGNKIRTEVTGWDGAATVTRKSEVVFDAAGRYSVSTKNALGHTTQTVLERNKYGSVTKAQNANGVITTVAFDALNRQISSTDNTATGNTQTTEYLLCSEISPGCPSGAQYAMRTTAQTGGSAIEYFDRVGRTMRQAKIDFKGRWVFTDTEYDIFGRTARKSEPYFYPGAPQYWSSSTYDILGRVTSATVPEETSTNYATSTITYDGAAMTTKNPEDQTKLEIKNTLGELVRVDDNVGDVVNQYAHIEYVYDTEGNLRFTKVHPTEGGTITTEIVYDRLNRKVSMIDPDKGTWSYKYNAFGELLEQTDGKGQVVKNTYDILGRLKTRTDFASASNTSVEQHTRWYFDGARDTGPATSNAIGQATAVVMSTSASVETCSHTSAQYCSYPTFDQYGRPLSTETHMNTDGNDATAKEVFATRLTYNAQTGRVDKSFDVMDGMVKDAGVAIESGSQSFYNQYGYMTHTVDLFTNGETYRTDNTNARGQVTEATIGGYGRTLHFDDRSGRLSKQIAYYVGLMDLNPNTPDPLSVQFIEYEWDVLGNLTSRHNRSSAGDNGADSSIKNLQETFCYDNLNRLIKTKVGNPIGFDCANIASGAADAANRPDMEYDSVGNITFKDKVGTYSYTNGKPHAVSSTSDDGNVYNYDANGNMTSDNTRTLVYSTFDKPTSIEKGSHTSHFAYGPDRSRFRQTDVNTSVTEKNKTTIYLGNIERVSLHDGTIEWRRYVKGGIHTYTTDASFEMVGDALVRYMFKDHLGSTDVIADGIGNVTQSMSFDAWGARRHENANLTVYNASELFAADDSITSRGFTGHEMLDEVGLIHMNGRIYDARLARFMQADPFVEAATDVQAYNRYSYLRNNPLNATDPSGYFSFRKFVGKLTNGIAGEWLANKFPALRGVMQAAQCLVGGAIVCGLAAFGNTYSQGGSFKDSLKAGVIAGISSKAFAKFGGKEGVAGFVSNGAIGGVTSVAQGGKFGHGFASAGLSQAVMPYAQSAFEGIGQYAAAAVVGGTVSHLTGGKFANGAVTGAFSAAVQAGLSPGGSAGEEFESSGLAVPTPNINTEASIPQESLTIDVEVAEPQMASAPLREAPRVEEVIVTAPRPAAQSTINPLNGIIANYYRAIASRQAHNALIAQQARAVAEQQSWDRFANVATTFGTAPVMIYAGGPVADATGLVFSAVITAGAKRSMVYFMVADSLVTTHAIMYNTVIRTPGIIGDAYPAVYSSLRVLKPRMRVYPKPRMRVYPN